jgi:hypothetical protein
MARLSSRTSGPKPFQRRNERQTDPFFEVSDRRDRDHGRWEIA